MDSASMASDAFFPFRDGPGRGSPSSASSRSFSPGGSKRDADGHRRPDEHGNSPWCSRDAAFFAH